MSQPNKMSCGKVALITGSSSGIGEATAKMLAADGYRVVICGSQDSKVERVARECELLSPDKHRPLQLVLDFNKPSNGELAVTRTVEHFGRLDVLVNNAGVFTRTTGSDRNSYEAYRQVMAINTDSTVNATLAAVQHLAESKGNIVFVSSVASFKASERGYAYCMSKAAMTMFCKCLAIDLAQYGIRVNCVSPGPVLTPIFERIGMDSRQVVSVMAPTTLKERLGRPEEIAKAIGYLISDAADFIQGHELVLDGGYVLKPGSSTASQCIINAPK